MAPPTAEHLNIVYLQADVLEIPKFTLPPPYTYTETIYGSTTVPEVPARISDASIVVLSALQINAAALSPETSPHLKLIVLVASGIDCVDLAACRKRGIVVSNCPNSNFETVAEHAIGLYFTTRRKLLGMHMATSAGEWSQKAFLMNDFLEKDGSPPMTCQDETVGVIGNGSVGKRIATLASNLGMRVAVSGRKTPDNNANSSTSLEGTDRVPFDSVIKQSTVLFIAIPLTESTRNLISTPELNSMSPHVVLINVSRGGIVDEAALVQALKERKIAGAATDVYKQEPASPTTSPLLADDAKGLNLVATPHLAWLSTRTFANYSLKLQQAVEGWCEGEPVNVVT